MGVVANNRRSVMILFSAPTCPLSHGVRLVLAEKNITFDTVDADNNMEELVTHNPYGDVPTLIDRDLVAYDVRIISEYLDERFPHPPLMPVDPVSRANARLALHRISSHWYSLISTVEGKDKKAAVTAGKRLREAIASTADIFSVKPFFFSEDVTLVDCIIAPVLWRLPKYMINLPRQAKVIEQYAERMFARESFQSSLTEAEQEMHP